MAINLTGPFLLMQGVAKHLEATGNPGSIVNILSTSAHVGQSFLAPYSASKGGLMTLTKNAANALLRNRIRVNGVAPGWMDTPAEDAIQKHIMLRLTIGWRWQRRQCRWVNWQSQISWHPSLRGCSAQIQVSLPVQSSTMISKSSGHLLKMDNLTS